MFGLTADIHCHNHHQYAVTMKDGTNSRLHDILQCLLDMGKYLNAHEIDTLVIAGDVFHSRKNVEHTVLHRTIETFSVLEEMLHKIYILAGNHDMSISGDGSLSISALETGKTQIIAEPELITIDNVPIGFIPYTEDEEWLDRVVEGFLGETDYLIGHLGIIGGKVGPSDFEVPGKFSPEHLQPHQFKRIFIGHFHKHQDVTHNIHYIGSPIQLGWGERTEEKGFIVFDPQKDDAQFVLNERSPRFVTVEEEADWEGVRERDYVKVIVDSSEDIDDRIDSERVKVERKREVADTKERINLHGKGDREMLEAYVMHDLGEREDKDTCAKFVQAGMQFLEEATCG